MKQKLIALLRTLFASKGFNAKELEGLADIAIKQQNLTDDSTDEDLSAASETLKPYADFVQSVASRQVTDAKKPKTDDPKPANPANDPKPVETPTDMPEWAKALVQSNQALAQGLQALQVEKVGNTRKSQVEKLLANSDDKFKAATLKAFGRMKFDKDEDFDEYLTELEADAKDFAKSGEGEAEFEVFRPTGGTGGKNASTKGEASETEVAEAFKNFKL